MRRFVLSLLLFGGALSRAQDKTTEPRVIRVHEGKNWIWLARQDQFEQHGWDIERFYDYADKAFDYLANAWEWKPRRKYALLVWPKKGGGFATGNISEARSVTGEQTPGIGVSYDAFFNEANGVKGYWGYALITHEMVNLFTGQVVSGGWPVDWWANHRSPFPLMTAVEVEYALVPEVAVHHGRQLGGEMEKMFVRLKDQFGWSLFRRAFAAARDDGINWEAIGGNPSALRTAYVCAYLQAGAPEDLTGYFEGVVPNFDANMAAAVFKARQQWRVLSESDPRRVALRQAFLKGDYGAAKKE